MAVRDVHLAVRLEGDMREGKVAKYIMIGRIAQCSMRDHVCSRHHTACHAEKTTSLVGENPFYRIDELFAIEEPFEDKTICTLMK